MKIMWHNIKQLKKNEKKSSKLFGKQHRRGWVIPSLAE
jgi:hypothetical protein